MLEGRKESEICALERKAQNIKVNFILCFSEALKLIALNLVSKS